MKTRLEALFARYGKVAFGVYLALCVVTFGGSAIGLHFGLGPHLPAWLQSGGTAVGAYALYKALMLPRIAAAAVITPVVARWIGRPPTEPAEEPAS
jgi:hypothetical protein